MLDPNSFQMAYLEIRKFSNQYALFIVSIVFIISWTSQCIHQNLTLNTYFNQINNCSQFQRFIDAFPFDSNDYFGDYDSCHGGLEFNIYSMACEVKVQAYWRNQQLFQPKWDRTVNRSDPYNRANIDCQYNNVKSHYTLKPRSTQYFFEISQTHCANHLQFSGGGTTFNIMVQSADVIIDCTYNDSFSEPSTYSVLCEIPDVVTRGSDFRTYDHRQGKTHCLQLTAIIDYEHFDAFSEMHTSLADYFVMHIPNSHIPIHRAITLNETFCFEPSNHDIAKAIDYHSTSSTQTFQQTRKAIVFSGVWWHKRHRKNHNKLHDILRNHSYNPSYDILQDSFEIQLHQLKDRSTEAAQISKVSLASMNIVSDYEFHPLYQSTDPTTFPVDAFYHSPETILSRNFTANNNHTYFFVGSSHMRYYYDSVISHFFGTAELFESTTRKHQQSSYHNLNYTVGLYANTIAAFLEKKCLEAEQQLHDSSQKMTFIVQSGSWDLGLFPLRRMLQHPQAGKKLLSILTNILSGRMKCPGLEHIVYITAPPFPMNRVHIPYVNDVQGYRSSATLVELNYLYINGLLHAKDTDSTNPEGNEIQLSIVDLYGITAPRVLLNEYFEFLCYGHLICREEVRIDGIKSSHLVFTPAGVASLESLLAALSAASPDNKN